MKWRLFIDDERFPDFVGETEPCVVARNSFDAIRFVDAWGIPDHIWFDHDLGGEDTSKVFIKWLTEKILDGEITPKHPISFTVHSMNPVGAKNIETYMNNLNNFIREK